MTFPFAHETWFDHGVYATDWGFAAGTLTLALLAAAVVATVVARFWPGVDVPALARLVPFMPFAIRLHLAVSMVGLLSLGFYLSPALGLQADPAGIVLGATMAVVAVTMATGWNARYGAALLMWFFGANVLMGHLPIYGGAMLALLVYGSHPQLRPAVSALLPPGVSLRRQPTTATAEAGGGTGRGAAWPRTPVKTPRPGPPCCRS